MMARIGFLGTGAIAATMVETIAGGGHEIRISERSAATARRLAAAHPSVSIAANEAVVADSDIVMVCLLAGTARDVLPHLPFRKDQAVISVMADVTLDELRSLAAPAGDCSIAIPLLSMPLGGTPLPVFPESPAQRAVFGDKVSYHPCADEAALNAHFAATGMLLPMLDLMSIVSDWLGGFTGDAAQAELYVAGLLQSQCASIAPEKGRSLADYQAGLSTPGGLNFTLSQRLKQAGAPAALRRGLDGLGERLNLPKST